MERLTTSGSLSWPNRVSEGRTGERTDVLKLPSASLRGHHPASNHQKVYSRLRVLLTITGSIQFFENGVGSPNLGLKNHTHLEYLNSLSESMPCKLAAVVMAKGGNTKN